MKIAPYRLVLVLLCFLGTFVLLQYTTGTKNVPILQPLANFPKTLGPWQMKDSYTSSTSVNEMLKVDDYIHYSYLKETTQPVRLYLAYYESVGTGGGYHSPKNCLPGGGWGISEIKTIQLEPGGEENSPVMVTEMIIRNRSEYQVVLYWYQNRGRTIYSEYWEKVYLVMDAILKGRRDGSFVRIMAYAPDGNLRQAEENAKEFAELTLNELKQFIPGR